MSAPASWNRRVGKVRPSHLMYSSGVGAIVDLPHLSVIVGGIDQWDLDRLPDGPQEIAEPRLLAELRKFLGPRVDRLYAAPWLKDADQVGIPVRPFPEWLRCTGCNLLVPAGSGRFEFVNKLKRRPDLAQYRHLRCGKGNPKAVSARFFLACPRGHLDDFPYREFVHRGGSCSVENPDLKMVDLGGNIGANVRISCDNCSATRNLREAQGPQAWRALPRCRGRHPHFGSPGEQFTGACDRADDLKLLVVGASNQWFAQSHTVLAVPKTGSAQLDELIEAGWDRHNLAHAVIPDVFNAFWTLESFTALRPFGKEAVKAAIARKAAGSGAAPVEERVDLHTPEWQALTDTTLEPQRDFVVRRDHEVPTELKGYFSDIAAVDRLRAVRALFGFTRLDPPDLEDIDRRQRVPLAAREQGWLPAAEVRGEGIFLRLPEELLVDWETRIGGGDAIAGHLEAYRLFRRKRWSGREDLPEQWRDDEHWPGARYIALHTLSHLLIREIALECGYNSASLAERIYPSDEVLGDPRAGILIYTAVPDAEGTLGGLVSLAAPDRFPGLVEQALERARWCSSDPLCGEREPRETSDELHAATCHACLFVSETTCERGNRFLDRRLIVPVGSRADLALWP